MTASAYSASPAKSITISVDRAGTATSDATVSYSTGNGTAIAGTDYTANSGTLIWPAGDNAPKSFTVAVAGGAAGKTFKVAVLKASGASVGKPNLATISVVAAVTPSVKPPVSPPVAPPVEPPVKPPVVPPVSPPVAGTGNSSLSVRVQGDHFIDANSVPVQLRGVNVSGLETVAVQGWNAADPWGGVAPNFAAIKTWKSNTVRLPLNEASWLGYTCVDGTGASHNPDPGHNYQATVKKAVADATAVGLYVIVDLHWTAPKNFWTSVAGTFKGYPNVLFELFNEPYLFWLSSGSVDWEVLMQGGTETAYVTGNGSSYTVNYTWQVAGMQQMLNAVRTL